MSNSENKKIAYETVLDFILGVRTCLHFVYISQDAEASHRLASSATFIDSQRICAKMPRRMRRRVGLYSLGAGKITVVHAVFDCCSQTHICCNDKSCGLFRYIRSRYLNYYSCRNAKRTLQMLSMSRTQQPCPAQNARELHRCFSCCKHNKWNV